MGYRNIEPTAKALLDLITDHNGFLNVTDKSAPEAIKSAPQITKNRLKKPVGALYKKRLIRLESDGIYLK